MEDRPVCQRQAPRSPDFTRTHFTFQSDSQKGRWLSLLRKEATRPVCPTAPASHREGATEPHLLGLPGGRARSPAPGATLLHGVTHWNAQLAPSDTAAAMHFTWTTCYTSQGPEPAQPTRRRSAYRQIARTAGISQPQLLEEPSTVVGIGPDTGDKKKGANGHKPRTPLPAELEAWLPGEELVPR